MFPPNTRTTVRTISDLAELHGAGSSGSLRIQNVKKLLHIYPMPALSPNSEVADGGGLAEAKPECARPRAQPLTSYQRWNIFQPPPIPRCCARGRAHSVYPNSKIAANTEPLRLAFARNEIVFYIPQAFGQSLADSG
jgi:hypothetical protein